MDNKELQTFLTVAKSGSFSQAAQLLHLTQPAVSKRIATLEHELKIRLFDRLGRQVLLTEAGQLFLLRAEKIINEIQDCRREIQNLAGAVSGSLGIVTSHHIGLHRLPPVLRFFVSQYPDVNLDLNFMDSETASSYVEKGQAELAIITLPLESAPSIQSHTIWQDDLKLVIGESHPLALSLARDELSLENVSLFPGILPLTGTTTRSLVEIQFSRANCQLRTHMDTNFLETIKMLVGVGLGWSILPTTLIDKDLLVIEIPQFQLRRELGVVWHSERTLTNAAKTMIDTLLRQAPQSNERNH